MDPKILKALKSKSAEIVDALFQEASDETVEARFAEAKARVKSKLTQLAQAKRVVANIEREIDDLKLELQETL